MKKKKSLKFYNKQIFLLHRMKINLLKNQINQIKKILKMILNK